MHESSNHHGIPPGERMEAYLDGLVAAEETAAVEQAITADPALQAQVRLQRQVAAALRQRFAPPAREDLRAIADEAIAHPATTTSASIGPLGAVGPAAPVAGVSWTRVARRMGIAAVLVGGIFGAWLTWEAMRPGPQAAEEYDAPTAWRSLVTVYRDEVDAGFEPRWVCADEQEFADTFRARFDVGLRLGVLPDGVQTLGLAYANALTPQTTLLLARVEGRPILVFIDRADRAEPPQLPEDSDLRLFHRRLDGLLLCELTPLEGSRLLEAFSLWEESD